MDGDEIVQKLREQRLATLQLAVQVPEERWREPVLPGARSIHDVLSHLLAWDEWTIGVFEISAIRELPESLRQVPANVDAFNARAVARFALVSRDDMIASLQNVNARVVASARSVGGAEWAERRLEGLGLPGATPAAQGAPVRVPRVGTILRVLLGHEGQHAHEIAETFAITAAASKSTNAQPSDA